MLNKSIENGREKRKSWWYKSRSLRRYNLFTLGCVCHNPKYKQCEWCRDNRLHANRVREAGMLDQIRELEKETA